MQISTRAVRLTRRWWLYVLLTICSIVSGIGVVLLLLTLPTGGIHALPPNDGRTFGVLLVPFAFLFPGLLAVLYFNNSYPKRTNGVLEVGPGGLSFNGRHLIDLASIDHADHLESREEEANFEVIRSGPRLRFQLLEPAVERTLMYAMGCDVSQKPATYKGLSRSMTSEFGNLIIPASIALIVSIIALVVYVTGSAVSTLGAAVAAGVGVLALVGVVICGSKSSVEVAASGITVAWLTKRWTFGPDEIVSMATRTIGAVTNSSRGWDIVEIQLKDGKKFPIPMQKHGARGAALRRRIELMLEHHRQTTNAGPAMLQRGQRPVAEWFRALRSAGHGVHHHRTAPVDTNQLWHVVGRLDAPAADRVASAIALRSHLDQGARIHLSRIASATSEPRVRVVLTALAEGRETDNELLAALEAVADERVPILTTPHSR